MKFQVKFQDLVGHFRTRASRGTMSGAAVCLAGRGRAKGGSSMASQVHVALTSPRRLAGHAADLPGASGAGAVT